MEPVVLDNKSDATEALSVATKLITQEGVVAHLGPATTGATLNTVPVVTEYKVPLITNSATNPDVTVIPRAVKPESLSSALVSLIHHKPLLGLNLLTTNLE